MRCHSFFVKSVARLDLFEKEGQFLVSLWRFFFIYENRPLQGSKCILRKRDFVSIQAFCRVIYIL